jgi:hypothetical protein
MLFDLALRSVRAAVARRQARCDDDANRDYEAAVLSVRNAVPDFVTRTTRALGGKTFTRTDLLDTLGRTAELIAQATRQVGFALHSVSIDVVSDLEDDVTCARPELDACDPRALAMVRDLIALPATHVRFHQVVGGGAAWQERGRRWRSFWQSLVPTAPFDTWTTGTHLSVDREESA